MEAWLTSVVAETSCPSGEFLLESGKLGMMGPGIVIEYHSSCSNILIVRDLQFWFVGHLRLTEMKLQRLHLPEQELWSEKHFNYPKVQGDNSPPYLNH